MNGAANPPPTIAEAAKLPELVTVNEASKVEPVARVPKSYVGPPVIVNEAGLTPIPVTGRVPVCAAAPSL